MLSTLLAGPGRGAGATESRIARLARVSDGVMIDGLLDEAAWREAPTIGELLQREPRPGEPPSEPTEVKVLHDERHLYVGAHCYDSEPGEVVGTRMLRDSTLATDDRLEVLLDTFHDRRNAYYFATNPAGALVDGLIVENGALDLEWDSIWTVRTRRTTDGWSAEFAIPFESLSFRSGQTTWGFNVSRTIQRKLEEDRWAGARLDLAFVQVSEAGELVGLEGVSQGIGLDVRPFASGRWRHDDGGDTTSGKPGLDAFYHLSPGMRLSLTANTDFAETEVDARQVNLTRFPLFFPEKRTFFLENAGVFSFSNTGNEVVPFFSRRIGLLEGEEVPLLLGAKLTGKAGRTDIGLLQVRTRDSDIAPEESFFVGRVKRELLRQSYVGAIVTHGDPALPDSSATVGTDLRLATSSFRGDRNLVFNLFGLETADEGPGEESLAYGFSLEYPNDLLNLQLAWREIERDFRPALGFVARTNVRRLLVGGEIRPRPKDFLGVRQMNHQLFLTHFTRADTGEVESWQLFVAPINWRFDSGDRVELTWVPVFERLFAPFEIAQGVVLPPGDYRFERLRLEAFSAAKRPLEARVTWWSGSYWSGHADQIQTFLEYKVPPRFVINLSINQTFARLAQGDFVTRLFSSRVNYAVSPFLSFSNLIQFDNVSRDLGWQGRARWTARPGNDLFLVVSQGWIQEEPGDLAFRAEESKVAAKVQYTLRF